MITVFTSSYNHSEFLDKAIESVLKQTYRYFEYILIDDGSNDATWEIMQYYANRDYRIIPLKLDKQKNVGVVINKSFQMMKGETWVWLPADDILKKDLLEQKLEYSNVWDNAIIYSHGYYINNKGKTYRTLTHPIYDPEDFRQILKKKCPIGLTGVWIPKEIIDKVGPFPEHLNFSEDFYWMLKACKAGIDFTCIEKHLYYKRKHSNSITGRNVKSISKNVDNIRREVGWI